MKIEFSCYCHSYFKSKPNQLEWYSKPLLSQITWLATICPFSPLFPKALELYYWCAQTTALLNFTLNKWQALGWHSAELQSLVAAGSWNWRLGMQWKRLPFPLICPYWKPLKHIGGLSSSPEAVITISMRMMAPKGEPDWSPVIISGTVKSLNGSII